MSKPGDFTGLSEGYQRHRPEYPAALLAHAVAYLGSLPDPLLVDVGAGTGIATRAWRRAFGPDCRIVGVEPDEDMRRQAVQATGAAEAIEYVPGRAEALPFAAAGVALVSAAQAIHWFDRPRFYAEAGRVLRAGGVLAVLNNNRNWRDDRFLDAYESLLEAHAPDYSRDYRAFDLAAELRRCLWIEDVRSRAADWRRALTRDDFVGLALSSSRTRAIAEAVGREVFLGKLDALIAAAREADGLLHVSYRSEIVLARKRRLPLLV